MQVNQGTQFEPFQRTAPSLTRRPSIGKPVHSDTSERLSSEAKSSTRDTSIKLNPLKASPKGLGQFNTIYKRQISRESNQQSAPQLGALKLHRNSRLSHEKFNLNPPIEKPKENNSHETKPMWRISTIKNPRLTTQTESSREETEAPKKFQLKDLLAEASSSDKDTLCFYLQNVQNGPRERLMQAPGMRFGGTLAQVDDRFYFFGGEARRKDLHELFCFEISTGTWKAVNTSNEGPRNRRTGHSAFGYKNKMLIFGGQEPSEDANEAEWENCLKDLWSFDPGQRTWTYVQTNSQNLEARSYHASCVHGSKFVINGGVSKYGEYLSDTWILDLETKQWQLAEMKDSSLNVGESTAYHKMCAVFSDTKSPSKLAVEGYYCFGGIDPRRTELPDSVKVLVKENKTSLSWRTLDCKGKKPAGRMFHSLEYHPGLQSLILYGGKDKNENILGGIYALNLQSLNWVYVKIVGESIHRPRAGHDSLIFGSQLWIAGGSTSDNTRQSFLSRFELDQAEVEKLQKPEDFESMELSQGERITDFCNEINRMWDLIDEKAIDTEVEETGYLYSIPEDDTNLFRLDKDTQVASPIRKQNSSNSTLAANLCLRTHSASTQIRISHYRRNLKSSSYNSKLPIVKEMAEFFKNNGSDANKHKIHIN